MANHGVGKLLAALAFATTALVPLGNASAAYILTSVSRPGATSTALFDVNNHGVMVGYSTPGTGPTDFASGFIYDGSTFAPLSGPAGAISSVATGISDAGMVVGGFNEADTGGGLGPAQGFIYDGGVYTTFNIAGASDTNLRGISPDGRYISGYYSTTTNQGVGFVYDRTGSGTLHTVSRPDSTFTIAQGVTSGGILVGSDIISEPSGTTRPGFFYDINTGPRTDVSIAGATRTALRAIDEAGIVAGWYFNADGATHGFVGSVSTFEQIDFAGADDTFVEGSNNARVLVGQYSIDGTASGPPQVFAFIATPVPEPATLALLAAALGVLSLTRKRTRPVARRAC